MDFFSQIDMMKSANEQVHLLGTPIHESEKGVLLLLSHGRYVFLKSDQIAGVTPASGGRIGLLIERRTILPVTRLEVVENLLDSGAFRIDEENVAHPKTVLREGDPSAGSTSDQKKLNAGATLEGSCKAFRMSCEGGGAQENNCAHYLSNAMIEAGIKELTNSLDCVELRCNWDNSCSDLGGNTKYRVVRAKNLRCWFAKKATKKESSVSKNSGFWATYQERASDGQGHVAILDTNAWRYYGTGWFSAWETQEYYQW